MPDGGRPLQQPELVAGAERKVRSSRTNHEGELTMDNQTILWIVIGVVALVIIGVIIWAVTRNNDDGAGKARLGKGGTVGPCIL